MSNLSRPIVKFSFWLKSVYFTHPVDEEGLDELDNLECDQETDRDQVVEKDDEGEEVEAEVCSSTICHGASFKQRKQ